jgi:hypothetical protein
MTTRVEEGQGQICSVGKPKRSIVIYAASGVGRVLRKILGGGDSSRTLLEGSVLGKAGTTHGKQVKATMYPAMFCPY